MPDPTHHDPDPAANHARRHKVPSPSQTAAQAQTEQPSGTAQVTPSASGLSREELLVVLRSDQYRRWKDGEHVPVEIALTPLRLSGREMVLCTVIDISYRKQLERNLRRREE